MERNRSISPHSRGVALPGMDNAKKLQARSRSLSPTPNGKLIIPFREIQEDIDANGIMRHDQIADGESQCNAGDYSPYPKLYYDVDLSSIDSLANEIRSIVNLGDLCGYAEHAFLLTRGGILSRASTVESLLSWRCDLLNHPLHKCLQNPNHITSALQVSDCESEVHDNIMYLFVVFSQYYWVHG